MAKRYIDLELANKWVCGICENSEGTLCYGCDDNPLGFLEEKDVAPVRHGRWEKKQVFGVKETSIEELQSAFCPVCQRYLTTPYSYYFTHYNYCPHCGAKMVEKSKVSNVTTNHQTVDG